LSRGFVSVVIHSDTASTSIQTAANPSALDENSVLFTCERRSLGAVFEIFGPVARPLYSVRMQSEQHIEDIKLRVGDAVFYAPKEMKFTNHVFTTQLLRFVGLSRVEILQQAKNLQRTPSRRQRRDQ
jgi:rRNA processing protein Gar1